MKINKIEQLKQPLGALEADIMGVIWELNLVSVRQVFSRLKKSRKIAYTTIMTVMSRLFEKGILKRRLNNDGAYIYHPAQGKEDFLAATSKKAVTNLIRTFGEVGVAQFIDFLETSDSKKLAEWQKKLKKVLARR